MPEPSVFLIQQALPQEVNKVGEHLMILAFGPLARLDRCEPSVEQPTETIGLGSRERAP